MKNEKNNNVLRFVFAAIFLFAALRLSHISASRVAAPLAWNWRETKFDLPPSIKVFQGSAKGAKNETFGAWRVEIAPDDVNLKIVPFVSNHPSGREPASVQAKKINAIVAVNGGYFDMDGSPAKTYSLVLQNGKVLRENIGIVTRQPRRYFVSRSAFGLDKNGKFSIAWIHHKDGKIYSFENPLSFVMEPNAPGLEYSRPDYSREWKMQNAIGGGPRLIQNGQERITYNEEIFFGSGFPNDANYPRCGIGWKRDNTLVLFTTDGKRGAKSFGLTLQQLSGVLLSVGCVEAMNLDGGGSETLVVNARVLNAPSDGSERPVTSILAIVPKEK